MLRYSALPVLLDSRSGAFKSPSFWDKAPYLSVTDQLNRAQPFSRGKYSSANQDMPASCDNWSLITVVTADNLLSLLWTRRISSKPPYYFSKIHRILCLHLCLGLPTENFPLQFSPPSHLYINILPLFGATCSANLNLFGLITRIIFGEEEVPLVSGFLSSRHGASSGCGWRNGLR